jgi:prepilin-type processing-associated H-X9-DG protein
MKSKIGLTRKDVFVAFCCTIFLLATLGAVGSRGRRRAKEAVCLSNLKRWGVIFHTFANDNAGYFVDRAGTMGWVEILAPYYGNPGMLLCPEARRTYAEGGRNPFMAWRGYDEPWEPRGSYCINLWIADNHGSGKVGSGQQEFWRTPYVAGAKRVPVLGDGQHGAADPVATDVPLPLETDIWTPNANEMQRFCVGRHNGTNVLFLDWSVRKISLKSLWRQKWHRTFDLEAPLPVWPAWMTNFKDPQ